MREPPSSTLAAVPTDEVEEPGPVPLVRREDWAREMPWLAQGTTGGGRDFRLSGEGVLEAFEALRVDRGMARVVCARQVHGSAVRVHPAGAPGFHLAAPCDGHATSDPGLLLAVTVADCVPVFLVAPAARAVALLHAGWRGIAQGVLETGVAVLAERFGVGPGEVHVHLGPSISRERYEVGPEVHRELGRAEPPAPEPLDLRAAAAERLAGAGVRAERIGMSVRCTRTDPFFFSHRGGDGGRQVAFLGIRAPGSGGPGAGRT